MYEEIFNQIQSAANKRNLKDSTIHAFISLCYEAGMDTSVILRISGHKHIKMMKYYTHLEENFVNKEFDKIREKM